MASTSVGTIAVDGDGHIIENPKRITELLDEPYREFRSNPIESSSLVPLDAQDRNLGKRLFRGNARTAQDWLDALERGPLDWTVLYPTLGLFSGYVKDPDYQAALCKAYNAWMAEDVCSKGEGRLLAVGLALASDLFFLGSRCDMVPPDKSGHGVAAVSQGGALRHG